MNWTEIILALIGLMGAILTGVLIPYLRTKMNEEQLKKAKDWLRVFCAAAETAFEIGAAKKEWVLKKMSEIGIRMDAAQLDACLEAVVRELTADGIID